MCLARDLPTARTSHVFHQTIWCNGVTLWEELLEKGVWIHLPMTIEMLLGPFQKDLVAEHSTRMPPEGALAHLHCLRHLLMADKPVLVHRHTIAHSLPTFSDEPRQ